MAHNLQFVMGWSSRGASTWQRLQAEMAHEPCRSLGGFGSQHGRCLGIRVQNNSCCARGHACAAKWTRGLVHTGMQANNKYADITVYFHRFNSCRFNYCMYIYFEYMHFIYNSTCIEYIDQLDGQHKQSARRVSYLVEDANLIYVTCRVGQ